jgi:hypothetical protein
MRRLLVIALGSSICFAAPSSKAFANSTAPAAPVDSAPTCDTRSNGLSFLLRSDFTDLGPLSCTHDTVSAQGATFSWTNNLLTGQNSAAADGLAILDYTCYGQKACGPNIAGYSIGPYLQGDDTYQFEPTKTQAHNGDTPTAGGFGEIAFFNPFLPAGYDDFRIRDGEAFASTGTRSNSFVGEWIPSYQLGKYINVGLPNEIGHTGLYYIVSPELMVQYDRLDRGPNNPTIFSTRNEALRIGPQVSMQFSLDQSRLPSSWPLAVRTFLGNTSALITNHESWDEYSGREYSWTNVSVSYTLPSPNQPSHLGITASYGYGNAEATGNKTNQVKLGLAVKF